MPTVILTNSTFSNSFPARRGDFLIYSTCEVLSASLLHCLQSRIFHPNWDFVSAARWLALSSGSKTHLGVLWTEEKGTVNGGVDYGTISLSSPPLHITQIIHTHTHTQATWCCLSPGSIQIFIQSAGSWPIPGALHSIARQAVLPAFTFVCLSTFWCNIRPD